MPRGLLDPRHGPDHDLAGGPVRSRLVIASTPRTGSTLLCRLLWGTGVAAAPKEYVNPVALRDWAWRRAGPVGRAGIEAIPAEAVPGWAALRVRDAGFRAAHLAAVEAARTDRAGRFAVKVHAHHARWWGDVLPGAACVVRLVRDDRVGQAISWARARQTGRWAPHQPDRPARDRPSVPAIRRRLAAIEADEAWWAARLAGVAVLVVRTEDLLADPEAIVRAVLRHAGVVQADTVAVPPVPTVRQADGRTAVWRDAWRRAHGEGTDLHRRL